MSPKSKDVTQFGPPSFAASDDLPYDPEKGPDATLPPEIPQELIDTTPGASNSKSNIEPEDPNATTDPTPIDQELIRKTRDRITTEVPAVGYITSESADSPDEAEDGRDGDDEGSWTEIQPGSSVDISNPGFDEQDPTTDVKNKLEALLKAYVSNEELPKERIELETINRLFATKEYLKECLTSFKATKQFDKLFAAIDDVLESINQRFDCKPNTREKLAEIKDKAQNLKKAQREGLVSNKEYKIRKVMHGLAVIFQLFNESHYAEPAFKNLAVKHPDFGTAFVPELDKNCRTVLSEVNRLYSLLHGLSKKSNYSPSSR